MSWKNFVLVAMIPLSACGVEGPVGPEGAQGQSGADGAQGETGETGVAGADGAMGIAGEAGVAGADGESIGLLQASFTGLTDLGPTSAYEGWLIVDGAPVSTGVFHVDADGHQTQSTFLARESDLDNATTFVLTIEPVPDTDPAPSHTHILGGDFAADLASLTVGHPAALNDDYSTAAGAFILKTPSTNADDTDDRNGIWWLDPTAGPAAGFDLPDLTDLGWRYEGWVVGPDGPISTGVFARGDEADHDGAGPTAGPDALFSPPFPGQDFITTPIDLTDGYAAVLPIEPFPDNSPAPFVALRPLIDSDITNIAAPALQTMENNIDTFPAGSVSRAR